MKKTMWNDFKEARKEFLIMTEKLSQKFPKLKELQQELVDNRAKTEKARYPVKHPVVYNTDLDNFKKPADIEPIKLILVADNPGRKEQDKERYLIGSAGTRAKNFFSKNHSILKIDFDANVLVLNKTPIHSPVTDNLEKLCRPGDDFFEKALEESQEKMAHLLLKFQKALDKNVQVWIVGVSKMKKNQVFATYAETLQKLYKKKENADLLKNVFLFHHFSMNRFTIDLEKKLAGKSLTRKRLEKIGAAYREEYL